jgi:cytochrome P450
MAIDLSPFPHVATAVRLTTYQDAEEALTSDAFVTTNFEPRSAPFMLGTLSEVNGAVHQAHRRHAAPLFARTALEQFEHEVLPRAIEQAFREAFSAADVDDSVVVNLDWLARRVMLAPSARIIGLDDADRTETAARLLECLAVLGQGPDLRWTRRRREDVVAEALEAKATFVAEFYAPSEARRRQLVEQYRAGVAGEEQLPKDLITALLMDTSGDYTPDLRVREAIVMLSASVGSPATLLVHTVVELDRWVADHPDQGERLTNPDFLRRAANEALRLHPSSPAFARDVGRNVVMRSGRALLVGQRVAVDVTSANRDPVVFGADADRFDPDRVIPRRYPAFGLSFGAGPHTCIGKPVVASTGTIGDDPDRLQRAHVMILRELYRRHLAVIPVQASSGSDLTGQDKHPPLTVRLQSAEVLSYE